VPFSAISAVQIASFFLAIFLEIFLDQAAALWWWPRPRGQLLWSREFPQDTEDG